MKKENKYSISKFQDTLNKLKEGVINAEDELEKDGVIKRFEFTWELLWKTLKIILEYEGIECKTPRSCLKEDFKIELIDDEDVFLICLKIEIRPLIFITRK